MRLFRRRAKPDEPLTALGRPWRSSVEPGLRTGLFDEEDAGLEAGASGEAGRGDVDADLADEDAAATRAALDPDIVSDLDDFADAVEALRPGDLSRLFAFWRNVAEDARMTAYAHAQAAAERTGRRDVIRRFQDELETWSRALGGRGRSAPERMLIPGDEPLAHGRAEVRPALVDTMVALSLQDELDDGDFETLFGPWRDAMGDGGDGSGSEAT